MRVECQGRLSARLALTLIACWCHRVQTCIKAALVNPVNSVSAAIGRLWSDNKAEYQCVVTSIFFLHHTASPLRVQIVCVYLNLCCLHSYIRACFIESMHLYYVWSNKTSSLWLDLKILGFSDQLFDTTSSDPVHWSTLLRKIWSSLNLLPTFVASCFSDSANDSKLFTTTGLITVF